MRLLAISSAALAVFVAIPVVHAADATTTFAVSATVNPKCVVSAADLSFGTTYVPGSGDVSATSNISVNCTKSTGFTVKLDAGGAADYASRVMIAGPESLAYQLYTDSNHTTIWGDGSSSTGAVSGTGLGMGAVQVVDATVYGVIPDSALNQSVAPGAYSDTVTVTVTY